MSVVLAKAEEVRDYAISIDALRVETRDFTLELTDLHIEAGACVALIGPNGAGKTTLMEALLGLRKANRLEARVLGLDIRDWLRRPAQRRRLGVLLQKTQLPFGLHVNEIVKLHRGLYPKTSNAVLEGLGIPAMGALRYDRLSNGQTQRTELFMALAHEPELIVLDEPFNGLDQNFAAITSELLRAMEASTVIMACHSPGELALADLAVWIQDGHIRAIKRPDMLRQELLGDFRLQVTFETAEAAIHFRTRLHTKVKPRFLNSATPLQLSLYGDEALVRLAQDLVQDVATAKLEFGRTTFGDLLYRCAQRESDA